MPGPGSAPYGYRKVKVAGGVMRVESGKTKHDHESGKWAQRLQNRRARGETDRGAFVVKGKKNR